MSKISDADYPSNSKLEQQKRKVKRLKQSVPMRTDDELLEGAKELVKHKMISPVGRTAKIRKKNIFQKMAASLFGQGQSGVGNYILLDVLIPAAKDTIQDMVTTGIEMMLFGESTGRTRRRHSNDKSYITYGSYFRQPGRGRGNNYTTGVRDARRNDYIRVEPFYNRLDGISFESRGEAEEVLDALVNLLEEYEEVSIADFYDISGLSNMSEYTDNAWGWTSLGQARITHTRAGWEIDFPRPIQLD